MSAPLLTYRGVVYPSHLDHMGHMNVMWYTGRFDEATWQLFGMLGLTNAYLKQNHRGMAGLEQHTLYKSELQAGDLISVYSEVLEVKEKTLRFAHEMRNDVAGKVAAITTLTAVFFDTVARKSCPFSPEIKAKANELIVSPKEMARPFGH